MRRLTVGGLGLILVGALTMTVAGPAAAATPPQEISIGGQSFPTVPLLVTEKYVVMDAAAQMRVLPEAKTALTASTYNELSRLTSAFNAADAALRAAVAADPATLAASQPAVLVQPMNPCTDKFHYTWGQPLNIYMPDCMAYAIGVVVGGPAAVVAFVFSAIGPLEWAAAAVVGAAIAAAAGLLASWAGWCDLVGPGNGVRFSWHWTHGVGKPYGYPTLGCW